MARASPFKCIRSQFGAAQNNQSRRGYENKSWRFDPGRTHLI